ncbi:MAG TPA: DnaA N-terminal domain-containing protein, partial [Anaerolineae bacterium]|nr:DnaA N-terminal domain-containing protein [Anaerolineae bacterium]
QINLGAVFVRALRDFAAEAGVDLGLRPTSDRDLNSQEVNGLGTQVPNDTESLSPLAQPSVNEAIWAETQAVLRPQMTRATYDTIIQGTRLLGRENGNYIIGVQTEMAKEWLENRLRDIVRRALSNVIGVTVNVEFRLTNMNR